MIYLDYNATTPIDPRVSDQMLPWLSDKFGNPSSKDHRLGWEAQEAVTEARFHIAHIVNSSTDKTFFTSGATESINTVLRSFVGFNDWHSKKIITCATEHDAVLSTSLWLSKCTGIEIEVLPVDDKGHISLEIFQTSLQTEKKILVALMAANNEIGVIHPIHEIGKMTRAKNAFFLCDVTQAVGKIPVDILKANIDFAAFSAHKIYGPKGIGALLIGDRVKATELLPLISGGGQELGVRAGTLNVPGIVGMGEACRIAHIEMCEETKRVRELRDHLENTILSRVSNAWINGDHINRISNTSNIGFKVINARTLIRDMHDVAVSTQAACATGSESPSHVLKAIGLNDHDAYSSIRFSLGRFTTLEEINYAIEKVITSVDKHRIAFYL